MVCEKILVLQKDSCLKLYRLKKGLKLSIVFDCCFGDLYTNYPIISGSAFDRRKFYCIKNLNSVEDQDYLGSLYLTVPGVFNLYVEDKFGARCYQCTIIVDPVLRAITGELNLDGIVLQTVLTKCLGIFPEWKNRLEVSFKAGYNMLHFSPVQELGKSKSSYSIKNHHKFNSEIFADDSSSEKDLNSLIKSIHQEWQMFSIIDVVWNHVSNDSEWILQHPEASYNLKNSPHLRPAFLLDRALWYLNKKISNGHLENMGISKNLRSEEDFSRFSIYLRDVISGLNLWQYFIFNFEETVKEFEILCNNSTWPFEESSCLSELVIIQDPQYKLYGCFVDLEVAKSKCFEYCGNKESHLETVSQYVNYFKELLSCLIDEKLQQFYGMEERIVNNILGYVKYHFIDSSGPRYNHVTEEHSISIKYFAYPFHDSSYEEDVLLMEGEEAMLIMAHNGWVMGGDALKNFAEPHSNVYLVRELLAWGDSIKLRYGETPFDSPYLWTYMKEYTEQMARIFHGFRIDNCHSTPIHVAEYLLDCARLVREDLYVVAELFTNNEETDNVFINRLGLNSLIRESLNAATSHELGRLVYHYGGDPVGSFIHWSSSELHPYRPHALFMDVTHDNPSYLEVRTAQAMIANAAVVLAGSNACGSNRGFDEIVPHNISVVNESRRYCSWSDIKSVDKDYVSFHNGLLKFKEVMNRFHIQLNNDGYNQIFVDQRTPEITVITRHKPENHESYIVIAHSAPNKEYLYHCVRDVTVEVEGMFEDLVLEAYIEKDDEKVYTRDDDFINGAHTYSVVINEHVAVENSLFCSILTHNEKDYVLLRNFPPGSVLVLKYMQKPEAQSSIAYLRSQLEPTNKSLDFLDDLSLSDFNYVLYRCENEEKINGVGGTYDIPGYGKLVYAGLQGIFSLLRKVRLNNDLGHPLCKNLRQGDWLIEYIIRRLNNNEKTKCLGEWFEGLLHCLKCLPRYLVPSYFEAIVSFAYEACLNSIFEKMSVFVRGGSVMVKNLALGSVQMCGIEDQSILPPVPFCDNLKITMAAGLPHFSSGFMRCWGRDTFVSIRGLLLITGRFQLARTLILAFGGALRHGLIPNLLSGGTHARYNARDATWFWLKAVKDYVQMSDESVQFLHAPVQRMYPTDDSEPQCSHMQPLQDVIHEIFQRHFEGVCFTERNAGIELDEHMSDDGFILGIGVDESTGFVYGGSKYNCGTWMDKMGSSKCAGNHGVPATPRDGSAIEIVALSHLALSWLVEMNERSFYDYSVVRKSNPLGETVWSYKEWRDKIQNNFEEKFFIQKDSTESMIHKREIYKDTVFSSLVYTDFQLRPNFPIAICSSSSLFKPDHVDVALKKVEQYLLGPLGLATLDPEDWNYNGCYNNDFDNNDYKTAKGFNYHQGPEWVWVLGPFLRAMWIFAKKSMKPIEDVRQRIYEILSNHKRELLHSDWAGLPELTNKNGELCHHSCPTQAWSMASILEVLYDIHQQ
ncbi:glycogen debranching enzyme isoform X1 [Hydra vulgaris]|uniref:glycogen debranching enzyme isoform X1 n=1 Tax=Hydra vulgaris TaxID=6087 RepID=UPI001F5EE00F|nr:glycogen debranching enzyme [Hydra vulgaris]